MGIRKSRRRAAAGTPGSRLGDGFVVLRSASGEIMHVSLPPVTSNLRSTVARLRLAEELRQRLGVISAIRGEGVTFISRSLALVLANDTGESVCVVDLNWRSPAAWSGEITERGGLADVLRGTMALDDAVVATGEPALWVLPAGQAEIEEIPVFAASGALAAVLDELDRSFDYLVLDLPALNVASEALTLAALADQLAVVVRQGVTPEGQVRAALEQLEGVPVLGVILNAFATRLPSLVMRRVAAL